jgi:hypothetical protein
MFRGTSQNPEPDDNVVADLQRRVQAAKSLQSVTDQELLADPRLNPATRSQADRLEATRLQVVLDLEHSRQLRRAREADRIEEQEARAARAVARAEEATDPAHNVLDLSRSRGRYVAGALAASFVLSVGSAMGLEAAVQEHFSTAPDRIGYLGEVALTGMATFAIAWRGKLARSGAHLPEPVQRLFVGLIAVPLLASIVGSTIGSGPVGAVCSVGAALFAWFAYLVSITSATAITQAVTRMKAERADRRTSATPGEGLPQRSATPAAETGIGDQTAAWLAELTENNARRRQAADGASATPGDDDRHPLTEGAATPGDQDGRPELEGNRLIVWEVIEREGVRVSNRRIHALTGLSRDTVRKHRTALWEDGWAVFPDDHEVSADDQ